MGVEGKRGAAGEGAAKKRKKAKKEAYSEAPGELAEAGAVVGGWRVLGESLLFKEFASAGGRGAGAAKLACFDLDGTLVKTKSGGPFAMKDTDWKLWNPKVFQKMQELHDDGFQVVIMSNQAGVNGKVDGKSAQLHMNRVEGFMQDSRKPLKTTEKAGNKCAASGRGEAGFTFGLLACLAIRKESRFRKPEPGMWDFSRERAINAGAPRVDQGASFFCGDAAGRPGDFSDTDLEFAKRVGLAFKTPEDVFGEEAGKKTFYKAEGQENLNKELSEALKALAKEYFDAKAIVEKQDLEVSDFPKKSMFKARALNKAATNLAGHTKKVESGKEAMALPGIGKGTAKYIDEFINTGKIATPEDITKALAGPSVEQEAAAEQVAAKKKEHMSHAFL